jgi:hypothetical protein
MADYHLDLTDYPAFLHRIVESWYIWQEIYLRSQSKYPGFGEREPARGETAAEVFWGRRPPQITGSHEMAVIDDGDISFYLVWTHDCFYIDVKERGARNRYWMFRRYEDAEKYLLFLISEIARPGQYTSSPAFRWSTEGVDPRVTLTRPDPVEYPGRVGLRVNGEENDRGWMGESDAAAGSHVLLLSFEELDSALREGIPADWFTINIRSG